MEISSIIKTLVSRHLVKAFLFLLIFFIKFSTLPCPKPNPAKLWRVIPPILQAARPVEAVTATPLGYLSRKDLIILRSNTDLPVPADPV